jgi:tetratricopeptide (TPR) repeat protein
MEADGERWKRPLYEYAAFGLIMRRKTSLFLLGCLLHAAPDGFGQAADARSLKKEGIAEFRIGHLARAETLLTQALDSARRQNDDQEIANTWSGLGDIYTNEERFSEAERAYQKALSILRQSSSSPTEVVTAMRNLGIVYSLQWRNQEAIDILKQAWNIIRIDSSAPPALVSEILNSLGVVYFRLHKLRQAEAVITQALQQSSKTGEPDTIEGEALNNLALIYQKRRKYDKAEQGFQRSLQITERALGQGNPDVALTRCNLGMLYVEMRRFEAAQDQFLRCLAITEQVDPIVKGRVFRTLHYLGSAYFRGGKITEAESVLKRALQIAHDAPDLAPETPDVLETYSNVLKSAGKVQEARTIQAEARKVRAELALTVPARGVK